VPGDELGIRRHLGQSPPDRRRRGSGGQRLRRAAESGGPEAGYTQPAGTLGQPHAVQQSSVVPGSSVGDRQAADIGPALSRYPVPDLNGHDGPDHLTNP
jgi:hypothetical protein